MSPNAVDMRKIPMRTLRTGDKLPGIGIGTFGSDRFSGEDIAKAVSGALRVGYRFVDCAACYGNEALIGKVLSEALEDGLDRNELFIVSKVWNDKHKPEEIIESCKKLLRDLQLDYLDGYLVHWPFANYHAPGCDADARNPDSRPYIHEEFMETWCAVEKLIELGLVKNIGVSNVTIPKLQLILRDAKIKPALNEMELHPCFQQGKLFQFCLDHNIQPIGFCPIGSPTRPDRDKTAEDLSDIEEPVVQAIAQAHGVHPAIVCVK